ncbi:hypothetical protein MNEG_11173 [Monoraphidium neglectum]|uniref:EF-hand domain-containing protein n=1 Tax=Monoraphidium neglectum TaxID=145388 RepID=A0A0D2KM25_9CHLO|nr:hypothetical protein MNEG_11173 [Monoraphidium neglectum]KIY96788.1 hypothetical protein MNEG_11173 [Monoraphidium neglectum]|eukprot:XP_013895808.1 hypothetical protein MNEG_11173 [Monoraphidium neglectum]
MGLFNFLWSWMCRRVFKRVDYDKNGRIDPLEVEVAILHLYNTVNKRLPGWQDPPTRAEIQAALRAYDADGSGCLEEKEFELFAKSLMHSGPDQFFARVGKDALLRTAVLPAVTVGVKNAAGNLFSGVPVVVLAPAIGCVVSAIKALIPM